MSFLVRADGLLLTSLGQRIGIAAPPGRIEHLGDFQQHFHDVDVGMRACNLFCGALNQKKVHRQKRASKACVKSRGNSDTKKRAERVLDSLLPPSFALPLLARLVARGLRIALLRAAMATAKRSPTSRIVNADSHVGIAVPDALSVYHFGEFLRSSG